MPMNQKTNEILEQLRARMEDDLTESYGSPAAAVGKFSKAVMSGGTPHPELAKLLYNALMALNDSMTSKGGLQGKLGAPLRTAAVQLLKIK